MKIEITKNKVLYWTAINIATILLAAGVYFFKTPNNFATGGVSGIGIILAKFITPKVPALGQTEIIGILNILLLIIGFIFLGRGCTFKTIYCTLVYTAEMQLMKFIPVELPLTNQRFVEFAYALLLTGAGSAILFNCKASSGGTDIIALIVKKYSKINVGKALLITDFLVAFSSFFVFDVETGLYSLLGLFAKSFMVDGVIENIGKSKYVTIITSSPELISKFILDTMHRSFTSYKAVGGFTGEERTIMITVCKRAEALRLKYKIHAADPSSFVIITDTTEILGKGFRSSLE